MMPTAVLLKARMNTFPLMAGRSLRFGHSSCLLPWAAPMVIHVLALRAVVYPYNLITSAHSAILSALKKTGLAGRTGFVHNIRNSHSSINGIIKV